MATIAIAYLVGAVFDAIFGTLLLFPSVLADVVGLPEVPSHVPERVALTMTASLLWGWTGLLLWGLRSPVERRGVLLLTISPVIAGLLETKFECDARPRSRFPCLRPDVVREMRIRDISGRRDVGSFPPKARAWHRTACRSPSNLRTLIAPLLDCSDQAPPVPDLPPGL